MDKEQTPFKYQQQVAILLSLSQTIARLTRVVGACVCACFRARNTTEICDWWNIRGTDRFFWTQ